jgi:succinoglycan biosynthesis protein ExoW
MTTPKISVIIPFFQRESGILARALLSIHSQGYPADSLEVIVVDDGSPVSAEAELQASPPPESLRIRVVKQQNAGPNEARNAGLELVSADTDLVAYLDSDDEWIGDHLTRASRALAAGYTAYFANLYHLGDSIPEFEKARRVDPSMHPVVADDGTLRAYRGDMVHQIATANIIFMPSLVIDARALGSARFPQQHRHGGGDYLYWMDLIQHGAKFVFSTQPEVRCGRGINMWYGSGWGTDGLSKRILDEGRFRRKVLDRYASSDETRRQLSDRLAELQLLLVQDAIHRLRRGKPVEWSIVRRYWTEIRPDLRRIGRFVLRRVLGR